jgi:hypothetical protein
LTNLVQQSIAAIRADGGNLSSKSLIFFSFCLDRLLTRLRILATLLVPQAALVVTIKFTFFNKHQHQADGT